MYYPFSIFSLQWLSSVVELIFHARALDQSGRTRISSFGWSDHLADGLHHQLIGRTLRLSLLLDVYSIADQLARLPSWSDSSSLHHQLRWGLLGILLLRGSCYVSSVCYQVAPCCSDQGACRCFTTDSLPRGYPGQYVRASAYAELDGKCKRQSIYPGSGPRS